MISGSVSVSSSGPGLSGLMESLKKLTKIDVLVGIPEENGSREGGKVTNAELAFIHTEGSLLKGIPARPFLIPAIQDSENQEMIAAKLRKAAESILEGNIDAMKNNLARAGMQGQNVVRDWFVNPKNNWTENAESTVRSKGSDRMLIDTGALRKAISFVVREKG